jgi:hypothetical protein
MKRTSKCTGFHIILFIIAVWVEVSLVNALEQKPWDLPVLPCNWQINKGQFDPALLMDSRAD